MCYRFILKNVIPTPQIEKYDNFLFVSAHTGDIAKTAGATVYKLRKLGKRVKFLIATDSRYMSEEYDIQTRIEKKQKEEIASAIILGVKEVEFLPFMSGGEYKNEELQKEIMRVIYDFSPDVIFLDDINTPNEMLIDDKNVSEATQNAIEKIKNSELAKKNGFEKRKIRAIAFYNSINSNYYVSISREGLDAKLNAIIVENSLFTQKVEERDSLIKAYRSFIRATALKSGLFNGKLRAEGFYVIGGRAMHNMPEVNF